MDYPTIAAFVREFIAVYLQEATFVLLGLIVLSGLAWIKLWYAKRALRQGRLPHEVIVTACIFDEESDGRVLLKPRTVQSAQPINRAFPNHALVDMIVRATKKCDETALGSFIVLPDPEMHRTFMKRVRDIVSEIGGIGQMVRACGGVYKEYVCYTCVTFSMDGPHRKIRIDFVSEAALEKLRSDDFIPRITNRPEEGSHADLVAILRVCADEHFTSATDAAAYVLRTSIAVPA